MSINCKIRSFTSWKFVCWITEESDDFSDVLSEDDEDVEKTIKGADNSLTGKKKVTFSTKKMIKEAKKELPYTFDGNV